MRVAMSHALVKKTLQMDACIHSGVSFFQAYGECRDNEGCAAFRVCRHGVYIARQRDMSKARSACEWHRECFFLKQHKHSICEVFCLKNMLRTAQNLTVAPIQHPLILDATCAPQNIAYPRDINLLNEARENLECIIDRLCYDCLSGFAAL